MKIFDLETPALLIDADALDQNLSTMAQALPGSRTRPHVKAHKCTALARRQKEFGHHAFTCATVREVEGMAAAGLGDDLLLANQVLDTTRLGQLDARVTVAVDSRETIAAARAGGVEEVLIDVNVGIRRCGCPPDKAGELAELARSSGLAVRGVMGYEGHAALVEDPIHRKNLVEKAMELLAGAHSDVGGDVISAGSTGTYAMNKTATEIQAGSYALMDTAYSKLGLEFRQALRLLTTVVSVSPVGFVVANAGLKALGMDHGFPSVDGGGEVLVVSDEHTTFTPVGDVSVGDLVHILPAHVDPTVAYHSRMHLVRDEEILDSWPVDLRGW